MSKIERSETDEDMVAVHAAVADVVGRDAKVYPFAKTEDVISTLTARGHVRAASKVRALYDQARESVAHVPIAAKVDL